MKDLARDNAAHSERCVVTQPGSLLEGRFLNIILPINIANYSIFYTNGIRASRLVASAGVRVDDLHFYFAAPHIAALLPSWPCRVAPRRTPSTTPSFCLLMKAAEESARSPSTSQTRNSQQESLSAARRDNTTLPEPSLCSPGPIITSSPPWPFPASSPSCHRTLQRTRPPSPRHRRRSC